ncbi:MAG: hypothetical protein EOO46_10060 [Flavobacterium sp.]|nr:MAG: hypothetical protein EOO46_10060 [Flavobacterium sp.]
MKIKILFILLPYFAIGQSKAYYKQTTTAYEINKTDTISKKTFVTYLDSLRKIITTENNITNAISGGKSKVGKIHSVIEVDTDRLYIATDIDEKGDTIGKLIYVYDENKNRTENYQIRNGDTVNGQKRLYNELGNYTKLYNKHKDSHKYFLSMEWEYDSKGNTTQCKTYNDKEKLVGFDKYNNVYKKNEFISTKSSYVEGKGFEKKSKEIKTGTTKTTHYYSSSVGYNYGLKISYVDGSVRIQEEDEKGNMKELRIFDNKKNLVIFVKNSEVKI